MIEDRSNWNIDLVCELFGADTSMPILSIPLSVRRLPD